MEEKETITQILIIEHGKLREMLARLIRASEQDNEEMLKAYDLFKEKEKRHVFIEENKIFNFNKNLKIPIIKTLILQHISMGKTIEQIHKNMQSGENIEELALKLQEDLRAHTDLEEEKFYALLDEQVPSEKKEMLISIIKEQFNINLS